jgi:hypothetical protein
MPSVVVGAEVRRKRVLNCCPWVRSLIHSPPAVTHSPAEILSRICSQSRMLYGPNRGFFANIPQDFHPGKATDFLAASIPLLSAGCS